MGPDCGLLDLRKVILEVIRGEPPHVVAVDLASSQYILNPAIHFGNPQPILKPSLPLSNHLTLTIFAQQIRCETAYVQVGRIAAMRSVLEDRVLIALERL